MVVVTLSPSIICTFGVMKNENLPSTTVHMYSSLHENVKTTIVGGTMYFQPF